MLQGLIELDETLILPTIAIVAIQSVSISKLLTLLNTIEDEIDALSLHSRAFIMAVSNAYGKQPHEFICERYRYFLDLMTCFKSMKDGFTMLQAESTTAPENIVQAYLSFAETW